MLDDSTSALDVATESRVQGAIPTFTNNVTTIYIAQRISAVIDLDQDRADGQRRHRRHRQARGTAGQATPSTRTDLRVAVGRRTHRNDRNGGGRHDRCNVQASTQMPTRPRSAGKLEGRKSVPVTERKDDTTLVLRRLVNYMAGGERRPRFLRALAMRITAFLLLLAIPTFTGHGNERCLRRRDCDHAHGLCGAGAALRVWSIWHFQRHWASAFWRDLATTRPGYKLQQESLRSACRTLSLSFFDRQPLGELMSRVTNDTETVSLFYESAVSQMIRAAFPDRHDHRRGHARCINWQLTLVALRDGAGHAGCSPR
jgi:hypothetical protein